MTKSVGPVPFSAEYLICRYVQTDGQTDRRTDGRTDELIRVELGNLFGPDYLAVQTAEWVGGGDYGYHRRFKNHRGLRTTH